jgi:hypothetical protein
MADRFDMTDASPSSVRAFAATTGQRHRTELEELFSELREFDGDERLFARNLVTKLQRDNLISANEGEALSQIVDALNDDTDLTVAVRQVDSLYRTISGAEGASPAAVAIAGVAQDSITAVAKDKDEGKGGKKGTAAADLAGALTGGNIGKQGGPWGLVIGVVVGGVGMSYLASKDEEKKKEKGK